MHNSNDINFLRFRYIQAPLAYPRERKRRMNSEGWLPFCVYRDGFNPEIYPALWSDYYNKNKREPENTQLAPWVARHFSKYHKFHWPLLEFMFCIYLHLPGPIRTVLEPAFTWRRKGDIDVSPVHDFFFVSTLTIDFWASKRLPVLNVCCRNQNNVYKILQSRAAEIVTYRYYSGHLTSPILVHSWLDTKSASFPRILVCWYHAFFDSDFPFDGMFEWDFRETRAWAKGTAHICHSSDIPRWLARFLPSAVWKANLNGSNMEVG